MAAERYRMTLHDLVLILRRRALLLAVSFLLIVLAATAIATALPPVFRSTATILVESQQIPASLVPTTVTTFADERIQIIRQRIMTRENQMRIIEKYGLFAEQKPAMSTSDMLEAMRKGIEVTPIHAGGGRRGAAAIAFEISFEHRSPAIAQAVANELVTLFLNENARVRTERASETTQFLAREAQKLEQELSSLENKLALYKQKYGDALPEHLDMRMGMLQRVEGELKNVEREAKATLEEMRFLDVELSAARAGLQAGPAGGQVLNTLGSLQEEYARLRQTFTDRHPDMVTLSRRIAALMAEERLSPVGAREVSGMSESDLRIVKIQTRMDSAQNRLASLRAHEIELQKNIALLEAQILKTPQVQRALSTLMRDYDNAQAKYNEIKAKETDAQMAESLERDEKAERFSLLEPPLMPDAPVKPNRAKIMLLGFFLAIGSSGGLAFMLETLNQRVRGAGALTQLMGRAPIVVVPYITTRDEMRRRRTRLWAALFGLTALAIAAAALTHVFYMPLDHLILKIAARLG